MTDIVEATAALVAATGEIIGTKAEVLAWSVGTVDGGPSGNGNYPFTAADGTVVTVPCPAKIAAMNGDPTAAAATLQAKVDAAEDAAAAAGASEAVATAKAAEATVAAASLDPTWPDLSEYAYALVDASGQIALGVLPSGEVVLPGARALNAPFLQETALSEVAWGIIDEAGLFAFGVATNGDLIHKGVHVNLSGIGMQAQGLADALDPTTTIDCWGDSLTHGNTPGVTIPFPAALSTLFGSERVVNNRGKSGQTSNQIAARMGAKPCLLTISGNTIPASGAVNVTTTENSNLSSKTNFGTISTTGTLYGVQGTLTVSFNSSDPNLAGTTTFTRTLPGSAIVIPNRTPFLPTTGNWEDNLVVIWVGRNDVISAYTDPSVYNNDAILANIQAMVDFLSPLRKRFVVLTVTDQASEYASAGGTAAAAFSQILALNYEIARRFPRNYVDVRKILVNSYNPSLSGDVTAFGRDQVPPSLQQDGLHLNNAGYAIVAQAVHDFIIAKGW